MQRGHPLLRRRNFPQFPKKAGRKLQRRDSLAPPLRLGMGSISSDAAHSEYRAGETNVHSSSSTSSNTAHELATSSYSFRIPWSKSSRLCSNQPIRSVCSLLAVKSSLICSTECLCANTKQPKNWGAETCANA